MQIMLKEIAYAFVVATGVPCHKEGQETETPGDNNADQIPVATDDLQLPSQSKSFLPLLRAVYCELHKLQSVPSMESASLELPLLPPKLEGQLSFTAV